MKADEDAAYRHLAYDRQPLVSIVPAHPGSAVARRELVSAASQPEAAVYGLSTQRCRRRAKMMAFNGIAHGVGSRNAGTWALRYLFHSSRVSKMAFEVSSSGRTIILKAWLSK